MNYLLQLMNLTPEASLEGVVDSLDDLRNIVNSVNGRVIDLFDNAFVKNKACERVKSTQWYDFVSGKKINQIVLERKDSYLNKEMIIKKNL